MRNLHGRPWCRTALIGLLGLVVVSCAELPEYATSRTEKTASLSDSLSFRENLEGGGSWVIPSARHRQPVDYKSKLRIVPDPKKLRSLTTSDTVLLGEPSPEEKVRRKSLPQLLEILAGVEERSKAVMAEALALTEIRASGTELDSDRVKKYQDLLSDEAVARGKLQLWANSWAEQCARLTHDAGTTEFKREVRRLRLPFIQDAEGKPVLLNVDRVAKELNAAIEQSNRDIAEIEGETSRLRLRAWLRTAGKEEPLPIHIEGYDSIRDHGGVKSPRVAFKMSEADRQRVEEGYSLAKSAATFVNDLRDDRSELRTRFREFGRNLRTQLDQFARDAQAQFTDASTEAFSNALARVNEIGVEDGEKEQLLAVTTLVDTLLAIPTRIATVKATVEAPVSPQELLQLPAKVAADINAIWIAIGGVTQGEPGLGFIVTVLEREIQRVGPSDEEASSMTTLVTELRQQVGRLKGVLEQYAFLRALLATEVVADSSTVHDLANSVDTRVRSLDLDQLVPGSINLDNTPAERGDEIFLLAELLGPKGAGFGGGDSDDGTLVDETSWTFPVEKFGLYSAFSAHLIFVDRQKKGAPGDPDNDFAAAPSVSWTMHYKVRVEPEGDAGSAVWDFFNPGVGVNIGALDFEDENFQVGLGAHLTFFDDLLQVGVGYNLNADDDNEYIFVGIGILEALRDVSSISKSVTGQ